MNIVQYLLFNHNKK